MTSNTDKNQTYTKLMFTHRLYAGLRCTSWGYLEVPVSFKSTLMLNGLYKKLS